MKKYLIIVTCLILAYIGYNHAFLEEGFYINFGSSKDVTSDFTVVDKAIYLKSEEGLEEFEIRGVDMGTGIPKHWSTDFAITKETYLEWFGLIKEMGANAVRVYTVNSTDFYEALYEYNESNDDPLYLIQGVWVDENVMNSHADGFDEQFIDDFIYDCKRTVDVIHGNRNVQDDEVKNVAKGNFRTDVSQWVIGYIVGVEWESTIVGYTNDENCNNEYALPYEGEYVYTNDDASPFENMLARVGDSIMSYESNKYGNQRLLAFSNWPNTDPFEYNEDIKKYMKKYASIDVEHIHMTDAVISGQFASYHIYPYYPNYINYMEDLSVYGIDDIRDYIFDGEVHSYEAYLSALAEHHSMPVIISEFGVPSSRGIAAIDTRDGNNHGGISEDEQAEIIVDCYKEIMEAGCAGCCVFSWQDEWFKRAWNTLYATDNKRSAYWSDYQTVEQSFGLMGYDTGYKDNCYNDGLLLEWDENDLISENDGTELYMHNDEKYVYFRIHDDDMNFEEDTYYIPIDVTPKSGSTTVKNTDLNFDRAADFLITINGTDKSDIKVQKRYEAISSTYSREVYGFDSYLAENTPARDSDEFVNIIMSLQEPVLLIYGEEKQATISTYVTGKLTYGNGNPSSDEYLSNSDFYYSGNDIEIRIPWGLLNFSDPSLGEIHDDYYDNYGISYLTIKNIYAGALNKNDSDTTVELGEYELITWNENVKVEDYLKASYYSLQEIWTSSDHYISDRVQHTEDKLVTVSAKTDVTALMYHDFKADGSIEEEKLGEYAIYASEFEEDLLYLKNNGYTTLNTQDLLDIMAGKMEMPENPIILTIDDGRYGVYDVCYPLLEKYDMKAVLSTIGDYIDEETIASTKMTLYGNRRTYTFCTWDEIKEMVDSGHIEVVSHSYSLHSYEEESVTVDINSWKESITNDVLKINDTYARKGIKHVDALAYPLSIRNRDTDVRFFEMGYTILYTGDIYNIRNDLEYTFTSKYLSSDDVHLVPRVARLHGNDIEYFIKYYKRSVYNVDNYG